jgi:hypothetical protein
MGQLASKILTTIPSKDMKEQLLSKTFVWPNKIQMVQRVAYLKCVRKSITLILFFSDISNESGAGKTDEVDNSDHTSESK